VTASGGSTTAQGDFCCSDNSRFDETATGCPTVSTVKGTTCAEATGCELLEFDGTGTGDALTWATAVGVERAGDPRPSDDGDDTEVSKSTCGSSFIDTAGIDWSIDGVSEARMLPGWSSACQFDGGESKPGSVARCFGRGVGVYDDDGGDDSDDGVADDDEGDGGDDGGDEEVGVGASCVELWVCAGEHEGSSHLGSWVRMSMGMKGIELCSNNARPLSLVCVVTLMVRPEESQSVLTEELEELCWRSRRGLMPSICLVRLSNAEGTTSAGAESSSSLSQSAGVSRQADHTLEAHLDMLDS
jgi:hypothetical protein